MPTFEQIISAEFDFAAIKELFFKLYTHPNIDGVMQHFRNFVDSLAPVVWALILAGIAVALGFFGKKLIFLPMLVSSFAVAFAGGAAYVGPKLAALVGKFIPIDPMVVGIVFGVIAAVLCLPVYFGMLAVGVGYSVYLVTYPLFFVILGHATASTIGLCCAIGVVVVVFIFRKWFEMGATALLGGFLLIHAIDAVVSLPLIVNLVIWGVFAVVGTIVQIKTRKQY